MQIIEHRLVVLFRLFVLIFQDAAGATAVAGKKHHEVVFEIVARLFGDFRRPCFHASVFVEIEASDPAGGGDVLVLLADRFLEAIDFDVAGLFRNFGIGDQMSLVRV